MVRTALVRDDPEVNELLAHAASTRQKSEYEEAARAQAVLRQNAKAYARRVAMWDQLAECETGGDWYNGGDYGGGLGIYVGTWRMYGGREFAARAQWASKDEQITIAERIARDGYGGWGCAHKLGWVN
jgi:Transglycosylase-like domain